jgi:hypothetical protein
MSLTKETLRDSIYEDLAQEDIVITDVTTDTGTAKRAPESYFESGGYVVDINNHLFEVNPVGKKDDKDYYDITTRRGNLKNPDHKIAVSDDEISEFTSTGTEPTPPADDARNLAEMQAQAAENHRLATVLTDRIIQHLLDYLWTEDAAQSIEDIREYLQIFIEKAQNMIQDTKTIATMIKNQEASFKQLMTITQTIASSLTGLVPSLATQVTQLVTLSNVHRNYSITGNSNIVCDNADELKAALDDLDSTLNNITYENSRNVL